MAVADDAHAAGRAARAAAADAGVRNVEAQARLQHAQTLGHAHLPVRIGHGIHAALAFAQRARAARHEHQQDRARIADRKVKQRYIFDGRALWRRYAAFQMLGAPFRLPGERNDFARALIGAEHRERRQQHGDGEKDWPRPFKERLQPQPEKEPDTAVRPSDGQKRVLHHDHVRSCEKIGVQRQYICGRYAAEQPAGDPLGADMAGKPERNTQAQNELRDFHERVAKMAALIERPQPERKVDGGRKVERVVDGRNSPPPEMPLQPRFHRGERNIAERVVEKMRKYIREHDEAAGKPHLPHTDAAQPHRQSGRRIRAARAHVYDGRCL